MPLPDFTSEEIARRVKMHNGLQMFLGVGLIPMSLALWWFSFWFFHIAFYLPLSCLMDGAWTVTFYLAWLCMIPLAIEGVRNTRPLFDLSDYAHSDFYDNFLMRSEPDDANPLAYAYLVSQVLYGAPRTMLVATKALRSFLPSDDAIARDAAKVLSELRNSRKWTPAENYKTYGAALMLLDGLRLIWTENNSGQIEIRYPAGMK